MKKKRRVTIGMHTANCVKFGGGSVMLWRCNSCDGIGPITK